MLMKLTPDACKRVCQRRYRRVRRDPCEPFGWCLRDLWSRCEGLYNICRDQLKSNKVQNLIIILMLVVNGEQCIQVFKYLHWFP